MIRAIVFHTIRKIEVFKNNLINLSCSMKDLTRIIAVILLFKKPVMISQTSKISHNLTLLKFKREMNFKKAKIKIRLS